MDGNRKRANRKRSKKLTYLKIKNYKLAEQLKKYRVKNELSETNSDLVAKLERSLVACSGATLYADCGTDIELVAPSTCKHKLCNICNWDRQKRIRRKYFKWFGENRHLVLMGKGGVKKCVTKSQVAKLECDGYEVLSGKVQYDIMHSTFTVPHTSDGFRGKMFYFKEIKKEFNFLRKKAGWLALVYGGEYGVEATKTENGYNIHIHALLFVKRGWRNRNRLHKFLLKEWNRQTVSDQSSRGAFTAGEIESIKRGNCDIDDDFVLSLNPKGATIGNLENIYVKDGKGKKIRSTKWNSDQMMIGVMEAISYHFKPKMFDMDGGFADIESIVKMVEAVHGETLYFKFGCLHGEKSLNLKNDDNERDDFNEVNEMIDHETGEIMQKRFFITNPRNMYSKGNEEKIELKKSAKEVHWLNAMTTREAIGMLVEKTKNRHEYADGINL